MASIVTLPTAPNTGLSTLAQVLLAGASDYAQNRRQSEREARLRAERLADIADERDYARTEGNRQYTRARTDRLADTADARTQEEKIFTRDREARLVDAETTARLGLVRELTRLGYLAPAQMNDPQAQAAAWAQMQADGLARRYEDALKTGDLRYEDLGNAEAVAMGLAAYGKRLAERTSAGDAQRGVAVNRSNQLVAEEQSITNKLAQLEARLAEPMRAPSPQEVQALAVRLARKKPGEMPSVAEIEAAIPQATKELTDRAMEAWYQDKGDAKIQAEIATKRLDNLRALQNTIIGRFGVVGEAPEQPPPAAPTASAPKPDLATAQKNFAAALTSELEKRRPNSGATSPATRLSEPAAAPLPGIRRPPPPEVFTPSPTPEGRGGARANEAIGDTVRAAGYGLTNLFRPSSWHGDFNSAYYDLNPEVEVNQLRARLAALYDQQSPTAVALKNRLYEIEQAAAQRATRDAQAALVPENTPLGSTPRRGLNARLLDPGF